MKKKISAILFAISLFLSFAPVSIKAECIEHQWEDWNTIESPRCTTEGLQRRTCIECDEWEYRSIPAIGQHTWSEWEVISKPTCTDNGINRRTCEVCDVWDTEEIPATGQHNWSNWRKKVKASCEKDGTEERYCKECLQEEEQSIPAIGHHSWKEWKTTKKATALSNGKKTRLCSECHEKESGAIPKLKAKVSLKEKTSSIESGKSHTIKIQSKTYGDKVEKWTSSNKKIATVTSGGKVTGKQVGTVTVTLKMKSGAKATCKINVTKAQQSAGSHSSGSGSTSTSNGSNSYTSGNNVNPPSSGYVWIPYSGSKYHKSSTCSGMRSPRQVTVNEAINLGYGPCSRCY